MTTDPRDRWLSLGISKTVYALPFPESRAALASAMAAPEALLARHDAPWTRRQDGMHEAFIAAWASFAAEAGVELRPELMAHAYPCAGASEAIRETLALLASRGRSLAIFEGEYEGFEAIASALGMKVAKVARERFREELPELFASGHELFASCPSAIDGDHWGALPDCMALAELCGGRIHLDLSYVGSCEIARPISAASPACASVFFSLSKAFGVYYRRIGGCLSSEPNPLLRGNLWFKNLDSLALGEMLLRSFSPGELPRRWSHERSKALSAASEALRTPLAPSDVFLLAKASPIGLEELVRRPGGEARICITPALDAAIRSRADAPSP